MALTLGSLPARPTVNARSAKGTVLQGIPPGSSWIADPIARAAVDFAFGRPHLIARPGRRTTQPFVAVHGDDHQGESYFEAGAAVLGRAFEPGPGWHLVGHSVQPRAAVAGATVTTKGGSTWAEAVATVLEHTYEFESVQQDALARLLEVLWSVGPSTPVLIFLEDDQTGEVPHATICYGRVAADPITHRHVGRYRSALRVSDEAAR